MPIDWRIPAATVLVAGVVLASAARDGGSASTGYGAAVTSTSVPVQVETRASEPGGTRAREGGFDGRAGADVTGASADPAAGISLDQQQIRPFRHAAHRALSCSTCHGPGERHRIARTWTAADCAACHHDPARGYACSRCHDTAGPQRAEPVQVTLSLTVWNAARSRELPFDHARHAAAKACQACHVPPVGAAGTTECAACHAEHHRPEADCALCHRAARPGAHGWEAHLTCTGSGCHARIDDVVAAPGAAMRPPLSRSLCLLCHAEQKDHEPARSCHLCHQIPESTF